MINRAFILKKEERYETNSQCRCTFIVTNVDFIHEKREQLRNETKMPFLIRYQGLYEMR